MTKRKQVYWLSDAEWSTIEPHLPKGCRGARWLDDRRVFNGIVHMLRSGARLRDCPSEYGPYTTIYNRFNRWSRQGIWSGIFCALPDKSDVVTGAIDAAYAEAHRLAAGAKKEALDNAIGASHGGRTTKIHSLTGDLGRPRTLVLTAGNTHDLERFLCAVNREGFPNQGWGDSSCMLVKEAGMHGSSSIM